MVPHLRTVDARIDFFVSTYDERFPAGLLLFERFRTLRTGDLAYSGVLYESCLLLSAVDAILFWFILLSAAVWADGGRVRFGVSTCMGGVVWRRLLLRKK